MSALSFRICGGKYFLEFLDFFFKGILDKVCTNSTKPSEAGNNYMTNPRISHVCVQHAQFLSKQRNVLFRDLSLHEHLGRHVGARAKVLRDGASLGGDP